MDIQVTSIVSFIVVLLIAMSFHEAMHAFVAHWLGDTTARDEGRLTLNPLSHIDLMMTVLLPVVLVIFGLPPILAAKPVPFNPDRVKYDEFGAALVGLAGPFTNLLLAILGAGIIRLVMPDPASFTFDFLLLFMQVNIGLFIFNMLPIPPLDGSRVLYAFAPEPLQNVMRQIEMLGILPILFLLLLLLPVLSPILNHLNSTLLTLLL
jgi:Zn-dependent protease